MRRVRLAFAVLTAATLSPGGAQAAETATYQYDAKGRLVKVIRTGTVNSNVVTEYRHDKADNRKKKKTTGAP